MSRHAARTRSAASRAIHEPHLHFTCQAAKWTAILDDWHRSGLSVARFTYDADGNLLTDGRWTYTWDGENRLASMETITGLPSALPVRRLEFVYDYMSRRDAKRVYHPVLVGEAILSGTVMEGSAAAVTTTGDAPAAPEEAGVVITPAPLGWELESTFKFVWDGWNLIGELDGNDAVVRTMAWGLDLSGSEQGAGGIGGLAFMQEGQAGATYHLLYDGNGDVTSLRDDAGGVAAGYEYGPFGETVTAKGTVAGSNPFRFSTKYTDTETGLCYFGHRYYNGGTGRWTSRDPLEELAGPCAYVFCANDAVHNVDEVGLDFIAVGDRDVKGTVGAFGHYSLQYWESTCLPEEFEKYTEKRWKKEQSSSKKIGGIELLADSGWSAYVWQPTPLAASSSGDWKINTVKISVVHLSESGIEFKPVFLHVDKAEVKKKWDYLKILAANYEYAENANASDIFEGPFVSWPKSEYLIGDDANNSNTFVRYLTDKANISFTDFNGSHPGRKTPRPDAPGRRYSGTPWKSSKKPPAKPKGYP